MHLYYIYKNNNWYFQKSNVYFYDSLNFNRQFQSKYLRFNFVEKIKINNENLFEIFLFLFFFTQLNTNIFKKYIKLDINIKKKQRKFTKENIQFLGASWHFNPETRIEPYLSLFFYQLFISFELFDFVFYKPLPLLSPLKILIKNSSIKKKTKKIKVWKTNNFVILRNKFKNFIFKNNTLSYSLFYRSRKDDFFFRPIANFFKKYNYTIQFSLKKTKQTLNIYNNYKYISNSFYYFIKSNCNKILFLNVNLKTNFINKNKKNLKKNFFYF